MIDPYLTDRMMPVPDGCVLWTGHVGADGYGQVWQAGVNRARVAHLVVWEQTHGPVPDGLELDHLCRQKSCCHTPHLQPVTHAVNMWRKTGMPDHGRTCRNGHDNWYAMPEGGRRCRTCYNEARPSYGLP